MIEKNLQKFGLIWPLIQTVCNGFKFQNLIRVYLVGEIYTQNEGIILLLTAVRPLKQSELIFVHTNNLNQR